MTPLFTFTFEWSSSLVKFSLILKRCISLSCDLCQIATLIFVEIMKHCFYNSSSLQNCRKDSAFVTKHRLHPSLIFTKEAKSLPLEWSPVRNFTSLQMLYYNASDKHASLEYYNCFHAQLICLGQYLNIFRLYLYHNKLECLPLPFTSTVI